MLSRTLSLAACSLLAVGGASGAIVFDDFNTGGGGTFIDATNGGTDTVDGVTLSIATVNTNSTFESTSTGTGITDPANDSPFQVETGEDYTISFDADGTLDQVVAFQFPGISTVTFTNAQTTESVTVTFIEDDNAGQTTNTFALGISFSSGDIINVTNTVAQFGGNINDGYRLNSLTVTIPEPASATLLALGAGLLARRRRV